MFIRSGYKTKNTGVVAKGPMTGAGDRPAFTELGLGLRGVGGLRSVCSFRLQVLCELTSHFYTFL